MPSPERPAVGPSDVRKNSGDGKVAFNPEKRRTKISDVTAKEKLDRKDEKAERILAELDRGEKSPEQIAEGMLFDKMEAAIEQYRGELIKYSLDEQDKSSNDLFVKIVNDYLSGMMKDPNFPGVQHLSKTRYRRLFFVGKLGGHWLVDVLKGADNQYNLKFSLEEDRSAKKG